MLRTLVKKQLREIFRGYFVNAKTNTVRSAGSIAGMFVAFGVVLTFLGGTFFSVAMGFAVSFFPIGYGWLFYAIMGIISLALGLFGSVFNTYTILYLPKDNELLLSMPIPPAKILLSRFSVVYILSVLYSQIVWLPSLVAGLLFGHAYLTPLGIIFSVVVGLLLSLFISVLTCLLGFVVALVASRLKKKSVITVIVTLVLFGGYMYGVNKLDDFFVLVADHADTVGKNVGRYGFLFAWLGKACTGSLANFGLFAGVCVLAAVLVFWLLSRTFIGLTTRSVSSSTGRAGSGRSDSKTRSLDRTLLRREFKRFLSSPTYMLNAGFGLIILPVAAVFLIIKSSVVRNAIGLLSTEMDGLLSGLAGGIPFLCALVTAWILGMNMTTTPSVSLEGNRLWILQSLPAPTKKILGAKLRMHLWLNLPIAVLFPAVTVPVLGYAWYEALLSAVAASVFVLFSGVYGLLLGLTFPNLSWTTESIAVKQGAAMMIHSLTQMFGTLIVGLALFSLSFFLPGWVPTLLFILGFGLADFLLAKKLFSSGVRRFEAL